MKIALFILLGVIVYLVITFILIKLDERTEVKEWKEIMNIVSGFILSLIAIVIAAGIIIAIVIFFGDIVIFFR